MTNGTKTSGKILVWSLIFYLFLIGFRVYPKIHVSNRIIRFSEITPDSNLKALLVELNRLDKITSVLLNLEWLFFNTSKRSLEEDFYNLRNMQGLVHYYNNDSIDVILNCLSTSIDSSSNVRFSFEDVDLRLVCELLSNRNTTREDVIEHLNNLVSKYDNDIMVRDIKKYLLNLDENSRYTMCYGSL